MFLREAPTSTAEHAGPRSRFWSLHDSEQSAAELAPADVAHLLSTGEVCQRLPTKVRHHAAHSGPEGRPPEVDRWAAGPPYVRADTPRSVIASFVGGASVGSVDLAPRESFLSVADNLGELGLELGLRWESGPVLRDGDPVLVHL